MSYGGYRHEQSFSFPLLGVEEILLCMSELQIPLQAEDLQKPSAATVRSVYEALCESCIGVTREEINIPIEDAMGHIEFPELHEESIAQLTYFRYVHRLLTASGVRDTTIVDITKPDAKRFRRNLSAVINFAKFKEERLINFTDMSNNTENLLDQRASLEETCAATEGKILQIQQQREAESSQVNKLREECRALEAELKQKNKQHAALQHETKQLKAKSNEFKDDIATLRFQKLNISQECERMESNIVRSPARLKMELAELRQQVETDRVENQRLTEQSSTLQEHSQALEKAESDIEGLLKLMRQVEEAMLGCKGASKQVKKMATSIKDHSNTMRQLETQREETQRQIQIIEERLKKLEHTRSLKLAAAAHAIEESTKERDALSQENLDLKSEVESTQENIKAVKAK
eukprot:CAMPEP_0203760730 /NCGR_PEP_ID=MMETSP0098-20131031/13963_1 /ASSEMBLY_ACC=CAM_ASM_000208 /TAXON_ID=96639 /ORGANISM=" , Strain NY0313808BC1" /LENGTH=406 /DNA_ID=CAMNT_0050654419 /DNA_START=124 /DNA_END=1341 /DNA_ORIENTATION=+